MTHRLTITESTLRRCAVAFNDPATRHQVFQAGVSRLPERTDWLVHDTAWHRAGSSDSDPRLIVAAATSSRHFESTILEALAVCPARAEATALVLGIGDISGQVAAVHCDTDGVIEGLEAIRVVGSELPVVRLENGSAGMSVSARRREPIVPVEISPEEVWSRTIGALGLEAWQRLRELPVAVVGCGRTGSLLATSLRRNGIERLTLIDPDAIAAHNLGEMNDVDARDLGCTKVDAVAGWMDRQSLCTGWDTVPIAETVLSFAALLGIKRTDLVFCCVDSPTARLATALIASLYLKPLIDLGTGIFSAQHLPRHRMGREREMGADSRLVLHDRCLLCLGGITGTRQAAAELLNRQADRTPSSPVVGSQEWRDQRASSLRSLNGLGAFLSMRLLEDLSTGRVAQSTWLHVEYSEAGIPRIEHRRPALEDGCPLCAIAGQGDRGMENLAGLLRSLANEPITGTA